MKRVRIVAEASVPYVKGVLEDLGEVTYLPSAEFTPETIKGADWLIVRSITKCNRALLEGSSVKLITSATIGFDHIDTAYCQEVGITWYAAPGCNAEAVALYFASAIALLATESGFDPRGKVLGIVGVGNVGRLIERNAKALGMEVLRNDPPRAAQEGADGFVSLHEIATRSDVIAFHTPLTKEGQYKTVHLLDDNFIDALERKPIVMNACRGPVTDNRALFRGLRQGRIERTIIDCWEGEPHPSEALLDATWLATPHIAGFSAQGKANGARTCVDHGLAYFGLSTKRRGLLYPPELGDPTLHLTSSQPLYEALLQCFDIRAIDRNFRSNRHQFEALRRTHPYPYEPSQYRLYADELGGEVDSARALGFDILER
ncbi:4-phosphoerythronate dehydrogenase [Porphyromonas levii]|uniref:4-phosphoerythronate dehydrogenase n=1 Tax=Porphyromonas levii TaxID=28114 RepID=UPI000380E481|nr:4-phosphoerythronate dehydrogenase [Porphyromonas levii]MBR8806023.1 Erythronate-4-phosphate dehydrogenase [Porphyromonas levii]